MSLNAELGICVHGQLPQGGAVWLQHTSTSDNHKLDSVLQGKCHEPGHTWGRKRAAYATWH